jgi:hypothetical protein
VKLESAEKNKEKEEIEEDLRERGLVSERVEWANIISFKKPIELVTTKEQQTKLRDTLRSVVMIRLYYMEVNRH